MYSEVKETTLNLGERVTVALPAVPFAVKYGVWEMSENVRRIG